tara:strand:+ start:1935 stop:2381 length:447 start_codon:yes stop_codon:yes gene_type:complete
MADQPRQKEVYEIIESICSKRKREDKVKVMREHGHVWALKDVLRGLFDTTVQWNLPQGAAPPYTPTLEQSYPTSLRRENRQFKFLFKGGPGDKMNSWKRENIFIGILEGVHPKDAELVVKMINKEKIEGLTRVAVEEAFPDLLRDSQK